MWTGSRHVAAGLCTLVVMHLTSTPANVAEKPQRALILSAGQGSRLLPHTQDLPKCLLDLAGRPMLGWQLQALAAAGIAEAVVVTGFRTELVEQALPGLTPGGMRVRPLFNPFYKVADNLGTCWMARQELSGPVLVLNGDTLISADIVTGLLAAPPADITVTIDRKPSYDEDDMKVVVAADRLRAIGKKLAMAEVNGESIGFLRFSSAGAAAFVAEIERVMRTPEGTSLWYLSAIHRLANAGLNVSVASIAGLDWAELDYPADLERCRAIAGAWQEGSRRRAAE
jgi:choline kinase